MLAQPFLPLGIDPVKLLNSYLLKEKKSKHEFLNRTINDLNVQADKGGLSVSFLLLLATFYFRVVKGKTFYVMMVHDAHSGCSAALEWQTPDGLTNFWKCWFFGKAVSSVSGVKGGLRLPTVGSRLSAPISPMIREIQSELQAAFSQQAWAGKTFSSVGLGWQVSSWGPQTLSSGVQEGCKFPAGKGARSWGQPAWWSSMWVIHGSPPKCFSKEAFC